VAAETFLRRFLLQWEATLLRLTGQDVTRCLCCGAGDFIIVAAIPARAEPGDVPRRVRSQDAEVSACVPGALRLDPGRASPPPRRLPLVIEYQATRAC
jgi:hypothetical protein